MAQMGSHFKEGIMPNTTAAQAIDDGYRRLLMSRRLHFAWHLHTGLNYSWRLAWTKSGPITSTPCHSWTP
jgi:hypothetical protein